MRTPFSISFLSQSSTAASPLSTRLDRQTSGSSSTKDGTESIATSTDEDIDEITQKLGSLWYPASIQDFSEQFERDKFGRLIPIAEEKDGNCSGSETSSKVSHSNWHDNVISSFHCVAANRFGTIDEATVDHQNDRKLKNSVDLIKHMNKYWAKELFEMNANEREMILNEVHGIKSKRSIDLI